MGIKCCQGCVAPKRHLACWSDCTEYLAEKAKLEEDKAAYKKKQDIQKGIDDQKYRGVSRAFRRKGRR